MNKKTLAVLAFIAGLALITGGRQASRGGLPDLGNDAIKAWFGAHSLAAVGIGLLLITVAFLGVYRERR